MEIRCLKMPSEFLKHASGINKMHCHHNPHNAFLEPIMLLKSKILVISATFLPWLILVPQQFCDAKPSIPFSIIFSFVGMSVFFKTLAQYKRDLAFYSQENFDEEDSQVKTTFNPPGGMNGRVRLLQYYPLIFLSCSVFSMSLVLQLNCYLR